MASSAALLPMALRLAVYSHGLTSHTGCYSPGPVLCPSCKFLVVALFSESKGPDLISLVTYKNSGRR